MTKHKKNNLDIVTSNDQPTATNSTSRSHTSRLFHRSRKHPSPANTTTIQAADDLEIEDIDISNKELKRGFFCRLFRRNKHKKMGAIQEKYSLLSGPSNESL